MTTRLIDKSAIVRLHRAVNASEWADRIERGLVRICTVTRLEVGLSARSASDRRSLLAELTVLHLDKDFELVAAFTGQPVERLEIH